MDNFSPVNASIKNTIKIDLAENDSRYAEEEQFVNSSIDRI
jgi:hypothetical protein